METWSSPLAVRQHCQVTEKSESGAERFSHAGDSLWKTPYLEDGAGRKLGFVPRVVHRWKAPRVQRISDFFAEIRERRPLAQASGRVSSPVLCPGWACMVCASGSCDFCLGRRPRESRPCGGHTSQRPRVCSRGLACEAGSLEIAVQLRLDGRRCWSLLPVPGWSRDKRCPSGLGRGEAPSPASRRRVRGAGRREPAGPWPEKPRLAPGGSVAIEPQGS